ncbi:MAG TPA: 16S rRNA (adenine(1518)-N(6)/adenine(1519)-N(6))-dimethyltransferase RsmA [Burkholderiaceae bacterium]|nr:16S rRNA (adenine(1518)-N(6)/adenine(1519)-N(6))-dimethyltransferase RsmA [Burkholderiaceae bacterium]
MNIHIPRKRFGQHFLTDKTIIDDIVGLIAPKAGQMMVEIGPGLAALTQPLVERLGHLTVIELDRDLAVQLRLHNSLDVIQSDVLNVDFLEVKQSMLRSAKSTDFVDADAHKLRIVGNLPYNISTPILFHLLNFVDVIEDQHFMLQKEVIDRMVSKADCSDYSRLSVMMQWRYEMENVLFVPPKSFAPAPRVDSAIVRMIPKANPPQLNVQTLSELVRVAFSQRRKLMRHTLGKWLDDKLYQGDFDLHRRAQEVPVEHYIELALAVDTIKCD